MIKKDTRLFNHDNDEMVWLTESSLPKMPKVINQLYQDFGVFKKGRCGVPPNFNRLTMSWYLNEPKLGHQPNVGCNPETYDFIALKNIESGEELTVKYDTYSETPKLGSK